jgi:hypothetical protein
MQVETALRVADEQVRDPRAHAARVVRSPAFGRVQERLWSSGTLRAALFEVASGRRLPSTNADGRLPGGDLVRRISDEVAACSFPRPCMEWSKRW